jgi:hypothetical protein
MAWLIVINLLSMLACYWIARTRSANRPYWVVMGLLFGPFAIPFVFFAKSERTEASGSESSG